MAEKKLEDKREVLSSLEKWIENMMNFIFTQSQQNLIKNRTSDTGFLLKSGKPPRWERNECIISYTAPYALFIEYGTDPHPVDPKKLIGWVKRKLRIHDPEAFRVAYAVANKISTVGTDPQPFLRPAINEAIVKYNLKVRPTEI